MFFKRKAYNKLLRWKKEYSGSYSVLLEGARRVGKSTIAEEFAKNEYEAYILLDFANISEAVKSCFDDIHNLDMFFLRLQAATGKNLIENNSVIIFDEIQLFPKVRQAIKYLVKDGRYHYIETGSLISIKKNVKEILIPSEEMKIPVYPMDFEEFQWATQGNTYQLSKEVYESGKKAGDQIHRKWMRDFRLYMAVGGMPQAVKAYLGGKNFTEIDKIKRGIISLYEDDFKKIDPSGRVSALYHSIPAQLSKNGKRYIPSQATGKRKSVKDEKRLYDLIDSKTVLISYNTTDPRISLSLTKSPESYKLYLADTGLFITLMFMDRPEAINDIYTKLLSDKLPANLGYLYENAAAQMIAAAGHELYYHTWDKEKSTHYYEIDFLISQGAKVKAIEVKSSGMGRHESLKIFGKKYSKVLVSSILVSSKDRKTEDGIEFLPVYMLNFAVRQEV
ncbi:ATP-binding protein [Treponema sp. OMZ 799]|uniref:ATP-binding protein n=1 Tax=Treponema sp. OMZ 799 TaxID=2563668 RepID=UPI0020A24269|nr:AAA family ATPase [Treponema sp. OMZ 799]UTC76811.1 ATP-binding protein [Treponema sp. OMZ 799]